MVTFHCVVEVIVVGMVLPEIRLIITLTLLAAVSVTVEPIG